MFDEPQTPEEIAGEMEKKINELVEESAFLLQIDKQKALIKAKEGLKKEQELESHRKQHTLQDVQLLSLKLFVCFNLAVVYEANEQYKEAENMYSVSNLSL
jgi:hypothetical protein